LLLVGATNVIDAELKAIRKALADTECHSHTSLKFQNDVLSFIETNITLGNSLIEVGCYRGGFSTQLAYMANRHGKSVHIIDIDPHYLDQAKSSIVDHVGFTNTVQYHLMDFPAFAATIIGGKIEPILVLVDGDHRYDAVVADIKALYTLENRPIGAAFHDYSLRYPAPEQADVRVDLAIMDMLGKDFVHEQIGEIAREGGPLRIYPEEASHFHFHEVGYSEGVLIEPRKTPLKNPDAKLRAGRWHAEGSRA
jgi:Methyltransferase domain